MCQQKMLLCKIPKDITWEERKRLAVASQILSRRQHIKHSCKSRRLTYPFRGFNYLRGNVAASFEFFPWCSNWHGMVRLYIDLVSRFYQAMQRKRLFWDVFPVCIRKIRRIVVIVDSFISGYPYAENNVEIPIAPNI